MEDILLHDLRPNTYESLENICPICLEKNLFTPFSTPGYNTPITLSETNSEYDPDEENFVDVELSDNSRRNSQYFQELWTCDGCNKTFHLNCIVEWKQNKKKFTCPNCRKSHILDIDIVNINHRSNIIYINNRYTNCIKSVLFTILGLVIFIYICFFSVITRVSLLNINIEMLQKN